MASPMLLLLSWTLLVLQPPPSSSTTYASAGIDPPLYSFQAHYAQGFFGDEKKGKKTEFDFDSLRGKVVLVANVASQCGYTKSDYSLLESLHRRFAASGKFEVLAFPCNQFGGQEPWEEEEIVRHVKETYDVKFPILEKVHVHGPDAHQVWNYLAEHSGVTPTWNFYKHLIDHNGELVRSFPTGVDGAAVEEAVKEALKEAGLTDHSEL